MSTQTNSGRGRKKEEVGLVVSDKMNKTISVEIYRLVKHSTYNKFIRSSTVFKAHDEKNEAKVGDKVVIYESRPLSRTKRWTLGSIVEKAKVTEGANV